MITSPDRHRLMLDCGESMKRPWFPSITYSQQRIDTLMLEQASTVDPARRKALFNEVQQVFAENLPALYFAAPRLFYAYSTRVTGVVPSVLRPPALWNADSLGVTGPARAN